MRICGIETWVGIGILDAQSSGVCLGLGVKGRGWESTQAEEKCPDAQGIVTSRSSPFRPQLDLMSFYRLN